MTEHYFTAEPTSDRERGLIKCVLRGYVLEFITSPGIFSHRRIDRGSRLLIESMELPLNGNLLDLGCGYGPIGIVAALLRPSLCVWMTDVNKRALIHAKENALRNGVENIRVIHGSLYEPVGSSKFDAIVSNPPVSAGIHGVVRPIIEEAPSHLKQGCSIQLVIQSNKGGNMVQKIIEDTFGASEIIGRGSGYRVIKGVNME